MTEDVDTKLLLEEAKFLDKLEETESYKERCLLIRDYAMKLFPTLTIGDRNVDDLMSYSSKITDDLQKLLEKTSYLEKLLENESGTIPGTKYVPLPVRMPTPTIPSQQTYYSDNTVGKITTGRIISTDSSYNAYAYIKE